jgi:hypothetical protein
MTISTYLGIAHFLGAVRIAVEQPVRELLAAQSPNTRR